MDAPKKPSCPLFACFMALLLALGALCVFLPAREKSAMENRLLARLPAPRVSSVLSGRWMDAAEDAVSDQFPLRDQWMLLHALRETAELRREFGGVLRCGNRLLAACDALDEAAALRNARALSEIAAECGLPVTLLLCPLPSRLYAASLPAGYVPADQAALTARFAAEAQGVRVLDCYEALSAHANPEALFYRSDHHWTADGALCACEWLCADMGWECAAPPGRLYADGFYGSLYARAPQPFWKADTLTFDRWANADYFVDGEKKDGLWDAEALRGRDKYAALLWGNPARATLVSRDALARGTLLVLKDSYANALLPALCRQFARVEIVDPRYFGGDLSALIQETEAEQILCVYGMNTLLTDRSLSLLAGQD